MLLRIAPLARSSQSAYGLATTSKVAFKRRGLHPTRSQYTPSETVATTLEVPNESFDSHAFDLLENSEKTDAPSLQVLDELDLTQKLAKGKRRVGEAMQSFQGWRSAVDKVVATFNLDQLRQLAKEAEVPRKLINQQQKYLKRRTYNKEVFAGALLIHRLGFEDPRTVARDQNALQEVIEVVQQISDSALFLLFTVRMEECRSMLQRHLVKLAPVEGEMRSSNEHRIKLIGTSESVTAFQNWLARFLRGVVTTSEALTTITSTPSTLPAPTGVQLQHLSMISSSVITIEGTSVTVSSVDQASAHLARQLLTQLQHERQCISERSYMSLTAPSIPSHYDAALPEYSMQMHGSANVGALLTDSSTYRLARQGSGIRDSDAMDWEAWGRDSEQQAASGNLPFTQRLASDRAVNGSEILESLLDSLNTNTDMEREGRTILSAEFGHLLFEPDPDASLVSEVSASPLSGSWPVEYGLAWLRDDVSVAESKGDLPSLVPTFTSAIPPSAADALIHNSFGELRDAASMETNDDLNDIPDDLRHIIASLDGPRKNTTARTALLGMLPDDFSFATGINLRYVNDRRVLTIGLNTVMAESEGPELANKKDKISEEGSIGVAEDVETEGLEEERSQEMEDGGAEETVTPPQINTAWRVNSMRTSEAKQLDVFIPDASVDARISAVNEKDLGMSAPNDPEWTTFLETLSRRETYQTLGSGKKGSSVQPPSSLNVDGQRFSLLDYKLLDTWSWNVIAADPSIDAHRPTVTQTNSTCLQSAKATASLQIRWNERVDKASITSLWQSVRRLLGPALTLPYGTGRNAPSS